ncbi:MAG: glycine cleavage system aminomethyltransferase GcvT [Sphingomonadales bacterium]
MSSVQPTALLSVHEAHDARLVDFAGYKMPLQYPAGIIAEHLHTRAKASLFDVSHMGQVLLNGPQADAALESLTCADLSSLRPGRVRYSLLMNEAGGIIDDLMVTRLSDGALHLVLNASRKAVDVEHLEADCAGRDAVLERLDSHALIALQGPAAGDALADLVPESTDLSFMDSAAATYEGASTMVSRCGYTGEDGFEISIPNAQAGALAEAILAHQDVMPAGLGARDSLRLEAGLCLYGNDIDEDTTPVQAGLTFALGKRRKLERDFPGAQRVMTQLEDGFDRCRVGLLIDGRRPVRAGAAVLAADGAPVGTVTSGGYSPTLERPIAMAYVQRDASLDGLELHVDVRGQSIPAQVTPLPFVPQRYRRRDAQRHS